MAHKAGFVALVGLPNAGKSTLMNRLLGQKLSIITEKPQTTRKNIFGILSDPDYQVIFQDTPGLLERKYLLQHKMLEHIAYSLKDADVILALFDIDQDPSGNIFFERMEQEHFTFPKNTPVIAVINKIDLAGPQTVEALSGILREKSWSNEVFAISAHEGAGVTGLVPYITGLLPEHPKYYPDDIVSMEHERFFVTELIREQVFKLFQDEIPYSAEVIIDDFKEREGRKDVISASIVVERQSQKGIIIGKQGAAIKKLGQSAREEIEAFLERPVFLEIHVKVREKWRSDENWLKRFGYGIPEEE